MTPRNPIARYTHWLHTKWPAGTVEKLPRVNADFSTNVPGLYVVGDLTGVPLLKFSANSGARVVQEIVASGYKAPGMPGAKYWDLVIVGAGVAGMAAALEARKANLKFEILEAAEPFFTIVNFPRGKPIYTYPADFKPAGDLQVREQVHPKETLVADIRRQTVDVVPRIARVEHVVRRGNLLEVVIAGQEPLLARHVIVAIGRSGNFRRLNVPGEDLNKVYNRLHDPKDFAHQDVLVVGGGDSALETAIAIAECGGRVTLSYRKAEFSRPKPENIQRLRELKSAAVLMPSTVTAIRENEVELHDAAGKRTVPNDAVFTMLGREAPLDFFRCSGVRISGEWRASSFISLAIVLAICFFIYHWKKGGVYFGVNELFAARHWFPFNLPQRFIALREPGFYYSLAYCVAVTFFGVARMRRRKTPYVKWQTIALILIQVIPLFLLPYIVLPWMGRHGWFDGGVMKTAADALFPQVNYGHGREYWRAFGLILAWPLFIWNVFTDQPMWTWLAISFVQTLVIIPAIIYFWGKGAYCGWICSCGALAETMGDAHREKMLHGPWANRANMIGQVFLLFAVVLLVARTAAWVWPGSIFTAAFSFLFTKMPVFNYVWFVDLFWAGILGVGLYWHFSGRVWCRFACPLAALMHIYARFSRFRILADKKRCISCNVCTSVCHQGIDVMSFANKGLPMEDPQCVRCSACVQMCPTGVLSFGQIDRRSGRTIKTDPQWLGASPVLMREIGVNGKKVAI